MNENILGNNIKKFRKYMGLTQTQLAQELEMNPSVISKYETGIIIPSLFQVNRIAKILNIPMALLMDNVTMRSSFTDVNPIDENTNQLIEDELFYNGKIRIAFDKLNIDGKKKVFDYIADLLKIADYRNTN